MKEHRKYLDVCEWVSVCSISRHSSTSPTNLHVSKSREKKIIFKLKGSYTNSHARILFDVNTFYHMVYGSENVGIYIFRLKEHNCEVNLSASISKKTQKVSRMKSFNFRSYELFIPIKIPFCTMLLCYSWLYLCVSFCSRHFDGTEQVKWLISLL